jgi:short-subunit dehydrogenase
VRFAVQDVTAQDYRRCLDRVLREEGPFDACVFCVGVGSELQLPDVSHEAEVFEVNLTAMVVTLQMLLPQWIERRRGHFLGLSSLADAIYNPGAPSYSASKAGFSNYLVSMGLKLRKHGVSVTNVRFGFVDTKMARAPVKPLMMTPARAAEHVLRCLERRPLQYSAPKVVVVCLQAVRIAQTLRVWMG